MSNEISIEFEVNNKDIMRDTLTELQHKFTETKNTFTIKRSYHDINIDFDKNSISCDSMDERMVNQIKQNYSLNFYRDKAIVEGSSLRKEVKSDGSIVLYLNY